MYSDPVIGEMYSDPVIGEMYSDPVISVALNLYEILGVAKDATPDQIQQAYKQLLMDLAIAPETDPKALAAVKEAYQYLSSPDLRMIYDASLVTSVERPASKRGPPPASPSPRTPPPKVPVFAVEPEESPSAFADLASAPWAKWVAGAVVLIAAIMWWRASHAPPKPPPVVVSQAILPSEPKADPTEPKEEAAAPAAAPSAPPPPGSNAETVFNDVSGSVARIAVFDRSLEQVAVGSGVVVGSDTVVTNCHVTKNGVTYAVRVGGATYNNASVLVDDEEYDLCTLRIPGLAATAVSVQSVKDLRTGQKVFAIGAPQGLELTISDGIVSSLREIPGGTVIQTTAPISPGSSGGGLFDTAGRLVGIMTFQHRLGQNLNFAVPADWISSMRSRAGRGPLDALASGGAPQPGPTVGNRPMGDTPRELVLGRWFCFGSLSGRNGEYLYGRDGTIRFALSEGNSAIGRYAIDGRAIKFSIQGEAFSFQVEVLTESKMVLNVGVEGQRLVCERR
jgi:S1-C subfamily serine protease